MKKIIILCALCFFAASLVFAQSPAATVAIKGVIIDNQCASTQKPENLAEFVKTHTKECALQAPCAASGYSIFSHGKLMKFDKESNAKIVDFLKKPTNKLQVVAVVKKEGDVVSLVSIENQK